MENQEPKSRARLAASIVLLVVIGASLIGAYFLQTNSTAGSTSTVTTTVTESFTATAPSNSTGSIPPTTSSSSTSSSSPSVPTSTTTVVDYGCGISNASSRVSALVLVNTSSASNVNVDVGISPTLPLTASACSYTYTNITTPVACGVMCGGGIGYTYSLDYVWKLNFSLSSPDSLGSYNLTIASGSGMGGLFPKQGNQIHLNSQQVTSWYSNPPCYGGEGIEGDCMASNATSIAIELPTPVESGAYQLVVSSGVYLVP